MPGFSNGKIRESRFIVGIFLSLRIFLNSSWRIGAMASHVFFARSGVIPDGPGASDLVSLMAFFILSIEKYTFWSLLFS